jgi:autotransporter-associated beta strand protein
LGQTNDAILAGNYTMTGMGSAGYMPQYGINNNNSIFNAIFIRWMTKFMNNRGLQKNYQLWLQNNANAAWNGRRASDNLSWCQWPQATPEGTNFNSFDCISSFEAMLAVPPTQTNNPTTVTLTVADASGASSFESGLNWSDNTAPSVAHDYVVSGIGIVLRSPQDGLNHYFAGSSLTLSNGAVLALKNTSSGNGIAVGTDLFLDNGEVADWANTSVQFSGKATVRSGGGRLDPQGNTFTIPALIGGTGALHIKAADPAHLSGTVILSGANTYTGGTFIDAAHTVRLSGFGTLGASANSLTFSNGIGSTFGTVDLNGLNLGVGNLSGAGGKILNNNATATTFTIGNNNGGGGIFKGGIADGTGTIALIKTGTGTITLANSTNRLGGGLAVGGGGLVVSNAALSIGNGSNTLTVVSVGNSGSGTFIATLDLSAATNFSASVSNLEVGVTTASGGTPTIAGTLKLGTSNTITAANSVLLGDMGNTLNTSVQSITTANGGNTTIMTPNLTLAGSKANATMTIGNGAKFSLGNPANRAALGIGVSPQGGSVGYVGNLDASGGTFNGFLRSLTLGTLANGGNGNEIGLMTLSSVSANHLDVSGGNNAVTIAKFVSGTGVGKANATLTIGNLDGTSVITSTNNGTAILIGATVNSIGTLNLNGGTLKIATTGAGIMGGGGTSTLNLNGVTLKAGTSSLGFITNLTSANLNAGGVTFDTAGFDIAIAQPLLDGGGGVTKAGAGKLIFSRANTYSGNTAVTAGTLALVEPGSMNNSTLVTVSQGATIEVTNRNDLTLTLNNQQTLAGGGVINGRLNALAGSVINPGDGIGTLSIQSDVALAGVLKMELNRANAPMSDELSCGGNLAAGGNLVVTNLGTDLQTGDVFQLFNKPVSGFSTVMLPVLGAGVGWTNKLSVDGTIQVVSVVSTIAPTMTLQSSGSSLTLSWPPDHTGWRLQVQTNGLDTNWFEVPGADATNLMTVPMDPANGSVFFRLVYP